MVIGAPGSGKSTLSRRIGSELDVPVRHLDHLYHLPGWGERPRDEVNAMLAEWVASDAWVIDGNRTSGWPERAARADLVVYLERPVGLRLWRVMSRIVRHHGKVRPDMAPGCPEQFSGEFLLYILRTHRRFRTRARAFVAGLPQDKVRVVRSDREAEKVLQALGALRITAA